MRVKDIGEIGLIRRLTRGVRLDSSVVRGSGDDTAVLRWTGKKHLLYTCDMLVEDVHFRRSTATPFQIGWKALGRNLSDIAAMGGVPRHAVVSLAMPETTSVRFVDGIYSGMKRLSSRFRVNIVGGDLCRSAKIVIDVSLLGEVEKNNLVMRSGAKRGDLIFVTGSIGGSAQGKHLTFMPRCDQARRLVKGFKVNSMIDVSDGLLLDLWRILDASGVGARVRREAIPLSRQARSFEAAVREGEDFELLFTMNKKEAERLLTKKPEIGVRIACIGEITDSSCGYRLLLPGGSSAEIAPQAKMKGFLHF